MSPSSNTNNFDELQPTPTSQVEILEGVDEDDDGLAIDLMDEGSQPDDDAEDSRYADAIIMPRKFLFKTLFIKTEQQRQDPLALVTICRCFH